MNECLSVLMLAVMIEDLWRKTISNWTVLGVLIVGMLFRFTRMEFKAWAMGTLVAVVFSLIFYVMGGLGGGDAKLLMALGGIFLPFSWLFMLTLSCTVTAVVYGGWLIWKHKGFYWGRASEAKGSREPSFLKAEIPFGPAIAVAVFLIQSGLVNQVVQIGGIG